MRVIWPRSASSAFCIWSSRPGNTGQPPPGEYSRQIRRCCCTLISSRCRSSTFRPGLTMSLACLIRRRRWDSFILSARSLRHFLVAVAITISAAERSKIWGLNTSMASRKPSNMRNWSCHWLRFLARSNPVSFWARSISARTCGNMRPANWLTPSTAVSTISGEEITTECHGLVARVWEKIPSSAACASNSWARLAPSEAIRCKVSRSKRTLVRGPGFIEVKSASTCKAS